MRSLPRRVLYVVNMLAPPGIPSHQRIFDLPSCLLGTLMSVFSSTLRTSRWSTSGESTKYLKGSQGMMIFTPRIHGTGICTNYLPLKSTKCGQIYHTWILWDISGISSFLSIDLLEMILHDQSHEFGFKKRGDPPFLLND